MKISEFLKKTTAAMFADASQPAPPPRPAPQPGVHLLPGAHTIDGQVVVIDGERGELVWHPLPRWGRYTLDGKIFYVHDPRRGFRL